MNTIDKSYYQQVYTSYEQLFSTVHLKPNVLNRNLEPAKVMRGESKPYGGGTWYGMKSHHNINDVVNAIQSGKTPGAETVRLAADRLADCLKSMPSILRKQEWADHGDMLDIGKVYSGRIDTAWRRCKRKSGGVLQGKHITLAVNAGDNAGCAAESLRWQGAYAAALADQYASAGYSVDLWAFYSAYRVYSDNNKFDKSTISVKLAHAEQPLDRTLLANTIAFPGFFRTIIFEAIMYAPYQTDDSLGKNSNALPHHLIQDEQTTLILVPHVRSLEDIQKEETKRQGNLLSEKEST